MKHMPGSGRKRAFQGDGPVDGDPEPRGPVAERSGEFSRAALDGGDGLLGWPLGSGGAGSALASAAAGRAGALRRDRAADSHYGGRRWRAAVRRVVADEGDEHDGGRGRDHSQSEGPVGRPARRLGADRGHPSGRLAAAAAVREALKRATAASGSSPKKRA